jgi:prepilin peptidase CpaA
MDMIKEIILIFVLITSLVTDLRSRKILNIITVPSILIGIIYSTLTEGLSGFILSGQGLVVGLGVLLIPYLIGGMGAGDVKLMAAIGALMGTSFVFYSFIYTALIGGLIAVTLIVKQRGFWNPLKNFLFNVTFFRSDLGSMLLPSKEERLSRISFPYGVAIVLGTFCTLIWGGF